MLWFLCVALTGYQRLMPQRKLLSWFMVWGGKAQDQAVTSCGTVTSRLHSVVGTHVRAVCVGACVYRRKTKKRNRLHNSLCIQCQSLRPNSLPRYLLILPSVAPMTKFPPTRLPTCRYPHIVLPRA